MLDSNRDGDVHVRRGATRAIAHAHALREQLRDHVNGSRSVEERWLTAADWEKVRGFRLAHRGDAIVQANAHDLAQCIRAGQINPRGHQAGRDPDPDDLRRRLVRAPAGARPCRFPTPLYCTARRTCTASCCPSAWWMWRLMTPFVVTIVAYTFFGLDALGDG